MTIIGTPANDILRGTAANDTLDGGMGADRMEGGAGNDLYIVDNAQDTIVEAANAGTDQVVASVSYTLGANVESLLQSGAVAINATGNALGNYIVGNNANNVVSGGGGEDSLNGQGGNDTLLGGLGDDKLDGGTGADRMEGGAGNDLYIVDNAQDTVVEAANAGTDEVVALISYTLSAGTSVEMLKLGGGAAINATGNELDNAYIAGNNVSNILSGLGGNDDLYGRGGNDTLLGGLGNDELDGGTGADRMEGGAGNDLYIVDNAQDTVVEAANAGTDEVVALISYTLSAGTSVEMLKLGGGAAINATGNELDNAYIAGNNVSNILSGLGGNDDLYGRGGNDTLLGGLGNDELDGGTGADRMEGGAGNDLYIVDNAQDTIVEAANAGTDQVVASVSYTLGANVESLLQSGAVAINATGNALGNYIVGNNANNVVSGGGGEDSLNGQGGNDTLLGGLGDDKLDGGTGADRMEGGAGNDLYIVDNAQDTIVEAANAGTDQVVASVSYTLGANVESLLQSGAVAINATGNALGNYIVGNNANNVVSGGGGEDSLNGQGGNDTLLGGLGDDKLDGGTGADRMEGGAGNDLYIVDNAQDTIVEAANAGTDQVVASVSYTLGANVESLLQSGAVAINATGNALGNYIVGNNANNVVSGGGGEDSLNGQGGNDTLLGGLGDDKLDGGAGADRMEGGAGNDVLVGGSQKDTMLGGADADVFVFRFVSDSPVGTPDVINDFQGLGTSRGDEINLSAIDADLTLPGNQTFSWVGQQPVHPGELGYSNGSLWGNVSGLANDVTPEFQIAVPDSVIAPNDIIL